MLLKYGDKSRREVVILVAIGKIPHAIVSRSKLSYVNLNIQHNGGF